MTNYYRLLEVPKVFDLPQQDVYELEVDKKSYYRIGGAVLLLAGWLGYLFYFPELLPEIPEDQENVTKLSMLMPMLLFVLGLVMVIGASKAKIIVNKNGIIIPDDIIPLVMEKIEWGEIEHVELTPVASNTKLMLIRRNIMQGKEELGILDMVKDKETALKIIRFKLGECFSV